MRGDAICIFQEDNESGINSTVIPPNIMMLIFHLKGQRASGGCERESRCSSSPSHSPLHFNWRWKQSTCQCWEHCEATVPSQTLSAFPVCPGHEIYNVATELYSHLLILVVPDMVIHCTMVIPVLRLGAQKQPQKSRAQPGPAPPWDSHPQRPRPSGVNFSTTLITLQ